MSQGRDYLRETAFERMHGDEYGELICKRCGKHEVQFTYTIDVYVICKECEKTLDSMRVSFRQKGEL